MIIIMIMNDHRRSMTGVTGRTDNQGSWVWRTQVRPVADGDYDYLDDQYYDYQCDYDDQYYEDDGNGAITYDADD